MTGSTDHEIGALDRENSAIMQISGYASSSSSSSSDSGGGGGGGIKVSRLIASQAPRRGAAMTQQHRRHSSPSYRDVTHDHREAWVASGGGGTVTARRRMTRVRCVLRVCYNVIDFVCVCVCACVRACVRVCVCVLSSTTTKSWGLAKLDPPPTHNISTDRHQIYINDYIGDIDHPNNLYPDP